MSIPAKIGFYSIRKASREVCKYVFRFTPLIRLHYPDSPLLHAALEAANLACAELVAQIDNNAPEGV